MYSLYRFLPTSYTLHSRIGSAKELISWIYLFPFYCFFAASFFGADFDYVVFILVYLSVISIYEIGYLYNDLRVSVSEDNPTLRVSDHWFHENFQYLVFSRLFFLIFSLFSIFIIYDFQYKLYYLIGLVFLGVSFCLHNYFRGAINVLTFNILSFFKYFCMLVLFGDFIVLLFTYICFPLIRTFEYASLKGYLHDGGYIAENLDVFRPIYYAIAFAAIGVFSLAGFFSVSYLLVPAYFLLYRFLILLFSTYVRLRD